MLALGLLPACTTLAPPAVNVTGVRVDEQTPDGARLIVTLHMANPNRTPLPLEQVKLDLAVEGHGVRTYRMPANCVLPYQGQGIVEVPASLPLDGPVNLASTSYRARGEVAYVPPGEIRKLMTDGGIPLPTSSFRRDGTLQADSQGSMP